MCLEEVAEFLLTAQLAASEAGMLLREKWQEPKTLTQKGFRDWVTDTDIAAQQMITGLIRSRHPAHGFLAEEASTDLPSVGDVRWIIDPIDGTTNYSRQQPNFCISIAAVSAKETLAGVILDPLRRELFSAARGMPALLDGQRIRVSSTQRLNDAVIAFDWAHSRQARQATLDSLHNTSHEVRSLRSIGSAALAMAWVAAGRLDAYWNWYLNAWDFAAGVLLVEQAGGRCTRLDGGPLTTNAGGGSCLTSNRILQTSLQQLIAAERGSHG